MSKNFYATPKNFKDLLGKDGVYYQVPPYQRDYAWDEENWEELWDDIITATDEHFMGFVILKKEDYENYEIIDGQQRLVTCLLVIAASIKFLSQNIPNTSVESERINKLKTTYFFNRVSKEKEIINVRKILLNKTDSDTFDWISKDTSHVDLKNDKSKSSQKLIKGLNFFYQKICNYFPDTSNGYQLFNFIETKIGQQLTFTALEVQKEEDAYVLFETLNSRGVQLAQADLLKNKLLSKLEDKKNQKLIREGIQKWKNITELASSEELTTLVRWDWIMRFPRVTEKRLFHDISPQIDTTQKAMDYLDHLENTARIFDKISHPKSYNLQHQKGYQNAVELLEQIKILGNKIPMPLLLIAFEKLPPKNFRLLCEYLEIILFRYSIIGRKDLKPLEQKITDIANHISKERTSFRWIQNQLKELYIPDVEFKKDFSQKGSMSRTQIVRYILNKLNKRKDDPNLTIEHILDKKPVNISLFPDFSKQLHEKNVKRIGNMMLLEEDLNGSLTGKNFSEKLNVYKTKSATKDFFSTETVAKYVAWNPSNLQKRQEEMANEACKIWCIKGW